MKVYVRVERGERFRTHTVRSSAELNRILTFARMGSQTGSPRRVYRVPRRGRAQLIARYEEGRSKSSNTMRGRRTPLRGLARAEALRVEAGRVKSEIGSLEETIEQRAGARAVRFNVKPGQCRYVIHRSIMEPDSVQDGLVLTFVGRTPDEAHQRLMRYLRTDLNMKGKLAQKVFGRRESGTEAGPFPPQKICR